MYKYRIEIKRTRDVYTKEKEETTERERKKINKMGEVKAVGRKGANWGG